MSRSAVSAPARTTPPPGDPATRAPAHRPPRRTLPGDDGLPDSRATARRRGHRRPPAPPGPRRAPTTRAPPRPARRRHSRAQPVHRHLDAREHPTRRGHDRRLRPDVPLIERKHVHVPLLYPASVAEQCEPRTRITGHTGSICGVFSDDAHDLDGFPTPVVCPHHVATHVRIHRRQRMIQDTTARMRRPFEGAPPRVRAHVREHGRVPDEFWTALAELACSARSSRETAARRWPHGARHRRRRDGQPRLRPPLFP